MNRRQRSVALDHQQMALFEVPAIDDPGDPTLAAASSTTSVPPRAGPLSIDRRPATSIFRHPLADREIRLGEHRIAYALRRARRRSIGFVVGSDGLSVNAPKWIGLRDIETALQEKSTWILRKLQEQQERTRRVESTRVEWRDGASIPFLGEPLTIMVDPRAGRTGPSAVLDAGRIGPSTGRVLRIALPHDATPAQIRDTVQSWLQREARRVFEERCALYALRLKVRMTRLSLSSAQTRWGSASADGSIRLNWRLIHFAISSIDYVVAHELAHLREMNHSPRFWDVVRSVLPDYEEARGTLKDGLVPLLD